jgi:hypothetical protein
LETDIQLKVDADLEDNRDGESTESDDDGLNGVTS